MDSEPYGQQKTFGTIAEHRVTLLQSEIKVRDQIANFKQKLDMTFLRLEQKALSDLRALKGQEMLAIRKRENSMLSHCGETSLKEPAKVFAFYPDQNIESFEKEITELGAIMLENETTEISNSDIDTDESISGDTDTFIGSSISQTASYSDPSLRTTADINVIMLPSSSNKRAEGSMPDDTKSIMTSSIPQTALSPHSSEVNILTMPQGTYTPTNEYISHMKSSCDSSSQKTEHSSVSRATSGYVHVGQNIVDNGSLRNSTRSEYCFVETGTLTRRSKHRTSVLDRIEKLKVTTDNKQDPHLTRSAHSKRDHSKSTWTANEELREDIMFTVLKDNRIVTVSKSDGVVTLYSPDFVVISTTHVSEPVAISYHTAYDIIAIVSRKDDGDIVELLRSNTDNLSCVGELTVRCDDQITCMTYSTSRLYLGCSGHHIHVIDENWKESSILPHAQLGQKLISIAYNDSVFCLVGSDGSVTYVDSYGRHLSKDSINALIVSFIKDKPFVLCRENGIKIVETSPREDEAEREMVVIKTGLTEVLDMHVSADAEIAILYRKEGNLDIRKYRPCQ